MGAYREIPIISDPSQRLTTVLSGRRCDFTINFNETTNRWSFDLAIDGELRVSGRRIVVGSDLILGLGIGTLAAVDWEGRGAEPGRTELPAGQVRLLHYEA